MATLPDGTTVTLQYGPADWEYDQTLPTVASQNNPAVTSDFEYDSTPPTGLYLINDPLTTSNWEYDEVPPTMSNILSNEGWEYDHVPPGPMEWFTATDDADGRIVEVGDDVTISGTATLMDGSPITDLFIDVTRPGGSDRYNPVVTSEGTFSHTFQPSEAGTFSYTVTAVGGIAPEVQEGWE